jgi:CheY-like chemotaxis protein
VPKTLLAVDDSTTMRKVLEITFAGEDFRVVGADGFQSALARLSEGPVAAVVDTALAGEDGYALAKELRARDPRLVILLLASRYSPYDANRGRDAGADDYADKPFDTQALIDKVKKAIVAREGGKPAAAPAPFAPQAAAPAQPPQPSPPAAPFAAPPRAPSPASAPAPFAQRPAVPTQRTHTLSFEGAPVFPAPVAAPAPPSLARTAPSGTPIVQAAPQASAPTPARAAPPVQLSPAAPPASEATARIAAPPRAPAPAAAAANGQFASSLGDLGLTPQQVEAVLALSRDVVERVVWEVVPQLAETLIREEIARLTRD